MSEQRPVEVQFRVIIEGFAGDLTASGTLEELQGLARKMKALDIEPANSPLLWKESNGNGHTAATSAPACPIHGTAMKPSTKGSGYFCPRKIDDGSFCKAKVAV